MKGEFTLPPIVYCMLNGLPILILSFLSMFVSQSDLGIAATIGTDFFNIFIIYYLILVQVILK
jgi:Ca2+/Na+ antiporter